MRLLLLFILTATCSSIHAQPIAPKKANKIVIQTSDDIGTAFRNFGRLLLREGYVLEQSDATFYFLTTEPREMKYGISGMGKLNLKLYVQFDESENGTLIQITGKYASEQLFKAAGGGKDEFNFDTQGNEILNRGGKASLTGASWIIMDELAKALQGGSITYEISE
ncbi:MAG: hypothetical protein OEQ53_14355 [Saprospiraceae bacterium]|nr:hypothetical protein [Saprospiraceae bacterium]